MLAWRRKAVCLLPCRDTAQAIAEGRRSTARMQGRLGRSRGRTGTAQAVRAAGFAPGGKNCPSRAPDKKSSASGAAPANRLSALPGCCCCCSGGGGSASGWALLEAEPGDGLAKPTAADEAADAFAEAYAEAYGGGSEGSCSAAKGGAGGSAARRHCITRGASGAAGESRQAAAVAAARPRHRSFAAAGSRQGHVNQQRVTLVSQTRSGGARQLHAGSSLKRRNRRAVVWVRSGMGLAHQAANVGAQQHYGGRPESAGLRSRRCRQRCGEGAQASRQLEPRRKAERAGDRRASAALLPKQHAGRHRGRAVRVPKVGGAGQRQQEGQKRGVLAQRRHAAGGAAVRLGPRRAGKRVRIIDVIRDGLRA